MSHKAVLVVAFNRPDLARKTLAAVAKYRPKILYFACDGPRVAHSSDFLLVEETRAVVRTFPWGCEIRTFFQKQNVGLRENMVQAIDWFFENESEGIVLEDDCIPTPDFFIFMEHILDKYRDELRVWGVTGSNSSRAPVAREHSYGFVRFAIVWGWASWANRWKLYDRDLNEYQNSEMAGVKKLWSDEFEYHAIDWHLRQIVQKRLLTTWAFPWGWTVLHNDGLWALPAENLITNEGVRSDATHTRRSRVGLSNPVRPLGRIRSPRKLVRDIELQHHVHRRQHRVLRPLWLNHVRNLYRNMRFILLERSR